ncbi:unnamed protein product [Mesocestoides corti]|uniref:Calponin-homology (CH) domain-containing protein n=1 Tax=Mesocestoides corti TaxID=53468 RepID=A0A3P6HEE2_MESCO|nr:unnamed protein product [Mesocestoides corti]
MKSLGFNKTHGDLRQALENCEIDFSQKRINFPEFKRLYQEFCKQEASGSVDPQTTRTTIYQYGSPVSPQGDDTLHSVSEDEQIAFCVKTKPVRNISLLKKMGTIFTINVATDFYCGMRFFKIINCSSPQTIDLRALHRGKRLTTYQIMENITLALNSARAIGCNVVNIGAADIVDGTRHLLLGLLWQIIKIGLLRQINVVAHSELVALLDEDETITEFAKLAPEQILMRWVNYHLKRADCDTRMENFTMDIKDCEVYAYLLEQISPPEKKPFLHSSKAILDAVDLVQRAEMVLQNAEKLNCRVFVQPKDIINGSMKLNLAFLANLFNTNPALDVPPPRPPPPVVEETREEKTYRNWINSMGLRTVVHSLYGNLFTGTVIFKLYDLIKAGTVDWMRVNQLFSTAPAKANFQQLENCNYMVELGHRSGFSLVGVAGSDLKDRMVTPILALLWQLMRAYTLSLLARLAEDTQVDSMGYCRAHSPISRTPIISERGIIDWVNDRLESADKTRRISLSAGFSDYDLRTGLLIIDLLESISPGCVDYSVVNTGQTPEERLSNAQYAITVARRIGAKIYAVPEDITEVKPRMLMTVFACLMATDFEKNRQSRVASPRPKSSSPIRVIRGDFDERPKSPPSVEAKRSAVRDVSQMEDSGGSYAEVPKSGYQKFLDESTLNERRTNMHKLGPQPPSVRVESRISKNIPLTIDIGKVGYAEKGTNYDPPLRRFFGSPPPPRCRHAELFSSPRLYRSELAKSATAIDQIGKAGYTNGGGRPQEYSGIRRATLKCTQDKEVQCEATSLRSPINESWNRDSKKSDIFAASVRDGGVDIQTAPNGVVRYSRLDGAASPPRRGFAAAYGEYANKTVQANRQVGSRVRRGGGRVFVAADIHQNR